MKPKSVMVFGAATAVMVVAAVFAVLGQRAPTSIPTDRAYAFPGLLEKVNDVAAITVVSGSESFSIKRTDDGWGLAEKGGYPVAFEKVKSTIVGLAEMKLLEPKTSDPERYERLDLGDPTKKDAKSRRIVLSDASGDVVAEGIIGRRNANLFGEAGGGTYLRRGDDRQSWLAEGTVEIGATPNDWMIRDIVNIDAEDVQRVAIRQPDGAGLVVHKADSKQENFTVEDIPEGRKLKSENEGKEVAGGLWRLSLEDVKPNADIQFPDKVHHAEYTTFDGLTVRVDVAIIDDEYWGRFSASAKTADQGGDELAKSEPAPEAKPAAAQAESEPAKSEPAGQTEEGKAEDGGEAAKKSPADRAKEINERVRGWTYRLSIGEGERLTTKMETLLEEAKPARS